MPLARVPGQFFVALTGHRNGERGRLCLRIMLLMRIPPRVLSLLDTRPE
jgi:hypothetical protein